MKNNRRMKTSVFSLVFIVILLMSVFFSSAVVYAADGNGTEFDNTDVITDLEASALNGVPFDVNAYPYDPNGSLSALGFVEYCYSDYTNLRGNYGLYLYVYNPALLDIARGDGSNKIEMSVEYDADGNATRFEKFGLKVCSVSVGVNANRFWKFKVIDREIEGKTFADRVISNERRYYISGFELSIYGDRNPREVDVSKAYIFTGFAEGYGSTDSPLLTTVKEFDSIDLKVNHTSFLANVSSLGNGHYNQVSSVYFAVPNKYFENYGNLQKILAEWYEYKLNPMIVTANLALYNDLMQNTKLKIGDYDERIPYYLYYGLNYVPGVPSGEERYYQWSYNILQNNIVSPGYQYIVKSADMASIIPLAFHSEVSDPYTVFKWLNKYKTAGGVTSNDLLDAMYAYENNLGSGYIDPVTKKLSADLFTNSVDAGRIRGYQMKEVDFGDTFNLHSFNTTSSWIEKMTEFGGFANRPDWGEDYNNVLPIYDVQPDDLRGQNEYIAKRLLINEHDVDAFKTYYEQYKADHHIILLRFAVTDYFSKPIGYRASNGSYEKLEGETDAYVCSESVFLDFDIIQLTFRKDGYDRAFAVVSDPIDVVGNLEPPRPPVLADRIEDIGQRFLDFLNRIKDWFKSLGNFFKESGKWILLVLGILIAVLLIVGVVKLISALLPKGRNKTTVHIKMPPQGEPKNSTVNKKRKQNNK